MILAYFILSHLIGDFLLQPGKLVHWKSKSKKGAFVHALVHFLVNNLILLPLIIHGHYKLIALSFAISFVHFWIDEIKITYEGKHKKKVAPFIIDQCLHLFTITIAYLFVFADPIILPNTVFYAIYTNFTLIIFLIFVIFLSTVTEVYFLQKRREKNKNAKYKIDTRKVAIRILVFTIVYTFFLILLFS